MASVTIYSFGPFRLDTEAEILFIEDEPVPIGRRPVALLRVLVENAGAPVSKTALLKSAWADVSVEESNLPVQIAALRKALGGTPGGGRWIETLPRRGYRFIGPLVASRQSSTVAKRHPSPAKRPATSQPEKADLQRSPLEPERRQLSILACELTCTDLDVEDMRDVVAAYQSCVGETGASFRGSVIRHLGHTVLLAFGYPIAHENDAEQAVLAGLALCRAVETLKVGRAALLRCRVGIATGLVIIGDPAGDARDHGAVGDAINVAARLQVSAQPGTVIVDAATRRMIVGLFDCQEIGQIGAGCPDLAYQVLRPGSLDSRFDALHAAALTPFVGRDEELALIARRWADVGRGQGRVVMITGEPGIGKSRLTRAAQEALGNEPHATLIFNSSPYHQGSAFNPIAAHLVRAAGIAHDDADLAKREKLSTLLRQSGGACDVEIGLISAILSIPADEPIPQPDQTPRQLKERTLSALEAWIDRSCARQPVLMLVEDLQWMDPTSLEWLTRIVEHADRLQLLLLATARPEFAAPWPNHRHITGLALSRLDAAEGWALIVGMTRGKSLPSRVIDQIVARTDGVPLFIEELTKTVLESGLLREAEDRYELTAPLPSIAIPSTLHASLLARLDRLEAAKDLAQIGAVVGREFSYSLIASVSGVAELGLRAALSQLVSAELVFQRGEPPDAMYVFKHALVQDTAYASLVRRRRRQLHGAIADALEAEFPQLLAIGQEARVPSLDEGGLVPVVAHHLTEAGQARRAVDYWLRAGEQALKRSANIEAAAHLAKGIGLIEALPASAETRFSNIRLNLALGAALQANKGVGAPETVRAYARARDLLHGRSSLRDHIAVLRGLWNGYFIQGRVREALDLLSHGKRLATRDNDAAAVALTNRLMGISLHMMGRFIEAKSHLEQSLEFYAADQRGNASAHFAYLTDDRIGAMSYYTRTLWLLGYPETARRVGTEALTGARARGHAMTIATALLSNLFVAMGTRDDQVEAIADELLRHSLENKLASYEFWATLFQGALIAGRRDPHGVEIMRRALAAAENVGSGLSRPMALGQLARAHASLDQVELASSALDEAIAAAEDMAVHEYAAELWRLRGEISLGAGKVAEAERDGGVSCRREPSATTLSKMVWSSWRRQKFRGDGPAGGWMSGRKQRALGVNSSPSAACPRREPVASAGDERELDAGAEDVDGRRWEGRQRPGLPALDPCGQCGSADGRAGSEPVHRSREHAVGGHARGAPPGSNRPGRGVPSDQSQLARRRGRQRRRRRVACRASASGSRLSSRSRSCIRRGRRWRPRSSPLPPAARGPPAAIGVWFRCRWLRWGSRCVCIPGPRHGAGRMAWA